MEPEKKKKLDEELDGDLDEDGFLPGELDEVEEKLLKPVDELTFWWDDDEDEEGDEE